MRLMRRCVALLIVFFIMAPTISTNVQAEVVKSLERGFLIQKYSHLENGFRPKPANYDENKPPILFVQGRNGNADSWYGKTVYHDINDMYDYALKSRLSNSVYTIV